MTLPERDALPVELTRAPAAPTPVPMTEISSAPTAWPLRSSVAPEATAVPAPPPVPPRPAALPRRTVPALTVVLAV